MTRFSSGPSILVHVEVVTEMIVVKVEYYIEEEEEAAVMRLRVVVVMVNRLLMSISM